MKNINTYILEKFKITKNTKVLDSNGVDEKTIISSFNSDDVMYCKYQNGRNNVGEVKLMFEDEHFYIKPKTAKNVYDPLPDTPHMSIYILKDLLEAGLENKYVIVSSHSAIDTTSRINNLKRTVYNFYFGENGMIFNDKKETTQILRDAKQNYKLSGINKYKVSTIKEAIDISKLPGVNINYVKFI